MTGDPRGVVLVVEDDANIRELIREALANAGIDVIEAADGEAAVRAAREHRPAAIVLDIGLPLLDGTAVADQVRDMYGDRLPFIVVTAGARALDISRIRALAEITKPFDVADLVSVVVHAIAPLASEAAERPKPQPAES